MAIKTPTPPTPPTPPVSPKGQDHSGTGQSSDTDNTEITSKDFGVHINISNPQDKKEKNQNTQQNTNGDNGNQVQKEVISKERDQLPEPQAVLTGDMPADKVLQTETQQPGSEALHLDSDNSTFGGISIWPFVLVFVAAFIGFTFLNYVKNKPVEPVKEQDNTIKPEPGKTYIAKADDVASKNKDDDNHKHFEIRI